MPTDAVEDLITSGIEHLNRKNVPESINCFNKAISIQPKSSRAWYNLGLAYIQLQEYNSALFSFDRAISFHPKPVKAYVSKGNLLLKLALYKKAGDTYDCSLRLDPCNKEAWWNKALLFNLLGLKLQTNDCLQVLQQQFNQQPPLEQFKKKHQMDHPRTGAVTVSYPYFYRGKMGYIPFKISEQINADCIHNRPVHYVGQSYEQFYKKVVNNRDQKKWLKPLLQKILEHAKGDPDVAFRIALSMVQLIPYRHINRIHDRTFFPYEVLYNQRGVCGNKSILFATILKELGFGAALLLFESENHMAVGIHAPDEYCLKKSGYAFVETTNPTIVTDSEECYDGVGQLTSNPIVISISNGKMLRNLVQEYDDAKEYRKIMQMGSVLDPVNYHRYEELVKKYAINERGFLP